MQKQLYLKPMKKLCVFFFLFLCCVSVMAQDDDNDIWREVDLGTVDYKKAKNYMVRIYGYYRFTDDGVAYLGNRHHKLYKVYEGICSVDIRYGREEDDGAHVIVGRDLVHPDRPGRFMEFYELKPYTFLEKARRDTKHFTIEEQGDTTRVYTKLGLAGIAVRDTLRRELRMNYNALSPDTAISLNLLIIKAHLSHVDAEAIYDLEDNDVTYVPQGKLKRVVFEGDLIISSPMKTKVNDGSIVLSSSAKGKKSEGDGSIEGSNMREEFHERTEIYVDRVVYMTRDEYRADKSLSKKERNERSGYKEADIDRLKKKLGVPPMSAAQQELIEQQRDWDDEFEQWEKTSKNKK